MLIRHRSLPDEKDRSWDKRTWLLASASTALCIVLVWFWYSRNPTTGPVRFPLLWEAALIVLLDVFPVLLTVVAQRNPFLWGALPFAAFEIASVAYLLVFGTPRSIQLVLDQLYVFIPTWIVLSSIGLVIRAVIHRRRLRREALAVGFVDDDPQAWPPAPRQEDEPITTSNRHG